MASYNTSFAIEVKDLVKHYPKATTNAIDTISLTVQRGEIFGLLGPNGAGKTTTIGVLTTSILPTSGSVQIMGIDVVHDPIRTKQAISVVPQRSNLDRSLKVREILTCHASYHGISRSERNSRADKLLAEFGLAERANERVQRYSGGMAQRVMLARALMHNPDVLFLDEPTNNLDPQSRRFLWERIRALNERGVTILLTTNDMEEADQLCDRIAIMDHGHILVLDTPAELKRLIPDGSAIELALLVPDLVMAGDPDPASESSFTRFRLKEALSALPGVSQLEEVDSDSDQKTAMMLRLFALDPGKLVTDVVQICAQMNIELRDLRLNRPTLEDVFIHLTGRKLRS